MPPYLLGKACVVGALPLRCSLRKLPHSKNKSLKNEVCCISYLLYLLNLTQNLLITRNFGRVLLGIVKSGLIILSRNPRFSFPCVSLSSLSRMEKIGVVVQAYNPSSCELRQKTFSEFQASLSYSVSSRLASQFSSIPLA